MDLFGINKRRERRVKLQAMDVLKILGVKDVDIQAAMSEGYDSALDISSFLTGRRLSSSIDGLNNTYTTYGSQVDEIYRKYNGNADFGCVQLRAVVDMRTAFIAGQGISVSCENDNAAEWISKFIADNGLDGLQFFNIVKGGEMCGQVLLQLSLEEDIKETKVKCRKVPFYNEYPNNYMPKVGQDKMLENLKLVKRDKMGKEVPFDLKNSVYIPIGGDDVLSAGPTPRLGLVLVDIENYDRALKDMRRNNHIMARITPTFKTQDEKETKALLSFLNETKWKIGKAVVGTAEFKYETPGSGAHDNLKAEMVANIKSVSSISGLPIHWLAYVDLMSNRSTADTLFEFINNATLLDRTVYAEKIKELIIQAQTMVLDSGSKTTSLKGLCTDFEVKIPLIDFSNFKDRVTALSMAFNDGAISMADYRNELPGIDPYMTKKTIEQEEKEDEKKQTKKLKSELPELPQGFPYNQSNYDKEGVNNGTNRTGNTGKSGGPGQSGS